ncbi:MAG: DUF4348 domain-containing protein [Bacteroidota bacterium]
MRLTKLALFFAGILFLACGKERQVDERDPQIAQHSSYLMEIHDTTSFTTEIDSPFIDFFGQLISEAKRWEARNRSQQKTPPFLGLDFFPLLVPDSVFLHEIETSKEKLDCWLISFQKNNYTRISLEKEDENWFVASYTHPLNPNLPDAVFLDFLKQFVSDIDFRKNHLTDPFAYRDLVGDEDVKTIVLASDEVDISLEPERFENMLIIGTSGEENKTIWLRGIENGIWVSYHFEKEAEKWLLSLREDFSR